MGPPTSKLTRAKQLDSGGSLSLHCWVLPREFHCFSRCFADVFIDWPPSHPARCEPGFPRSSPAKATHGDCQSDRPALPTQNRHRESLMNQRITQQLEKTNFGIETLPVTRYSFDDGQRTTARQKARATGILSLRPLLLFLRPEITDFFPEDLASQCLAPEACLSCRGDVRPHSARRDWARRKSCGPGMRPAV